MTINMKTTFDLPNFESLKTAKGLSQDRIVVVSIVGKSPLNARGFKIKPLGRIFPRDTKIKKTFAVQGFYDDVNQIIYLHISSYFDADVLIQHYDELVKQCIDERKCDGFLPVYDEVKSNFAKALLLLASISHIVVLSHPGSSFDSSYFHFFRTVDDLSMRTLGDAKEALSAIRGLSQEWINNGRFCTPRILFYFERCPRGVTNIKKLEHNMEDRIYHVLKRTRLMTNTERYIFAIPMNEEFVFVSTEEPVDRLAHMIKGLVKDCQPGATMQMQAPFCTEPYQERSFVKFLQVHIKQARDKGFDDIKSNSSRNRNHFELPALHVWISATEALYDVIMTKDELIPALCIDTRFSEQRCLKVLPMAMARYQDALPSHYSRAEHERRILATLALFSAQARGPVFQQYIDKLQSDCRAYWENGRQQCEAASITGKPCKLPKHSDEQDHHSTHVYKAACNCGRKICPREDSYTAKQANHDFYQLAAVGCCEKLERVIFPVFQPSIKDFKAANLKDHQDNESCASNNALLLDEAVVVSMPLSDRSGAAELFTPTIIGGQNNAATTTEKEHREELTTTATHGGLTRQASTVEYLPGMLTLSSPPGLLPQFQSWSLVCLGASSLYSHNVGLTESQHPGFLSSTNYLLPWDVTVSSKVKVTWPNHGNKHTSRGRRGKTALAAATGSSTAPQFSVKVFIGVEYECTLGHRFMLAAPDKMLKATPGSIVKDNGNKIAESDMPLYYPCVCRVNKLAQLARLHVVTPKAPVYCTLDARVQPAPGAPIFVSTKERPIKLTQSAYWVMRLPFVYDAGEIYKRHLQGKLLRGVFGVTEVE